MMRCIRACCMHASRHVAARVVAFRIHAPRTWLPARPPALCEPRVLLPARRVGRLCRPTCLVCLGLGPSQLAGIAYDGHFVCRLRSPSLPRNQTIGSVRTDRPPVAMLLLFYEAFSWKLFLAFDLVQRGRPFFFKECATFGKPLPIYLLLDCRPWP